MKRLLIVICSIIVFGGFYNQHASASEEENITDVDFYQYQRNIDGIQELNSKRAVSLLKSNKNYYLYIGFKECPYCREFSKNLNEFKHESILPIYYFNLTKPSVDLNDKDKKVIENFMKNKANFYATPTFLKVQHGEIKAEFVGSETSLLDLRNINFKK